MGDNHYTDNRLHTQCGGNQWIKRTFTSKHMIEKIRFTDGKINVHWRRIDGAKIYVLDGTTKQECGEVDITGTRDASGQSTWRDQTYTIECNKMGNAIMMEKDGACLELAVFDGYGFPVDAAAESFIKTKCTSA